MVMMIVVSLATLGTAQKWTTFDTANSGLAGNSVIAIAVDKQGNKWFGTDGRGVSKFDGATWTTYTTIHSVLSNAA
jgi:ligand-binding sensor domain-containing protein